MLQITRRFSERLSNNWSQPSRRHIRSASAESLPRTLSRWQTLQQGLGREQQQCGIKCPKFLHFFISKEIFGIMLTKVTKSSGLEIYCCSIMFGVHHGFATMMNIFQRTIPGETKFRPGANLPPACHCPKCLLALQVSSAPTCKPAEVSDIRNEMALETFETFEDTLN